MQEVAGRHTFDDGLTRLIESPVRRTQSADALETAECCLHGPLTGHVAAKAQRREQIERGHVPLGTIHRTAE